MVTIESRNSVKMDGQKRSVNEVVSMSQGKQSNWASCNFEAAIIDRQWRQ
jgi:hypothetical protein